MLASISSELRRQQYATGRLLVKHILSQALNCQTADIDIWVDHNGKPYSSCPNAPEFSISHTKDYVVVAEASVPVGVDYEHRKHTRNFLGISEHYFSENECKWIRNPYSTAQQEERFYHLWVLKEAHAKATGRGLSDSLALDYLATKPEGSKLTLGPNIQLYHSKHGRDFHLGLAAITQSPLQIEITNVAPETIK
ncbi:hypothetical protein DU002_02200 [Corallincola holothuriorum]|uniref:4'-phosphopantetheinyl transferase domain-containing protein n=1 Tax=Corallincola holothuriorum TaxID=2282215 RepID=A0A368NRK5_9GAMM|nr:hypothetical protein DU002_02200 [Corallincola holothuriorum]